MFLGWDPDDRDKALWWLLHKRQTCPSCGTRPDQWDPDRGGDPRAFVSEPVHCRGCEVAAQGDEWLDRQPRNTVRRGTTMRLVPNPELPTRTV